MSLQAGAPLPVLVGRLKAAGWGVLGGETFRGLRLVLDALAVLLDARSGQGKVTAPQLAMVSDYTERWVRRNLTLLEEAGIIEWHRGGIVAGRPTPSWIRVDKTLLLDLVHVARRRKAERLTEQTRATRHRLARLRTSYTQPRAQKRPPRRPGKHHAELPTALPPNGEDFQTRPRPAGRRDGERDKKDDAAASRPTIAVRMAELRAATAANPYRRPGNKQQQRDRR